jgi:hypothetical protein
MHWWSFVFGAIAGGVVMTLVTFVVVAESLAPFIKARERYLKHLRESGDDYKSLSDYWREEDGHKRSEFRSEL